ncbi:MAG: GNAT family N-acetyltransferase [Ruminiclostridium sp.]|nr:GNAT family N-acetyltransferase [Ruminiclostridium sp.]
MSSKYIPKIVGEKIYLSPMFLDDLEQYTRWMNDFEVTRYLGQASRCISLESEKKYLENLVSDGYNFAVVLKEEERLIGNASIFDIQHLHQRAEIGLFIGEAKDRSKGYGQEIVRLLADYGFRYLNLNNIMLKVFSGNSAAINTYRKCGFREIGRRTRCYLVENKWHDEIFMEILRDNTPAYYGDVQRGDI